MTPVNTSDVTSVLSRGIVQRRVSETANQPVRRIHVRESRSTFASIRNDIINAKAVINRLNEAYDGNEGPTPEHFGILCGKFSHGILPSIAANEIEKLYGCEGRPASIYADGDLSIELCLCLKITAIGPEVDFPAGKIRSARTNWFIVAWSVSVMFAIHLTSLVGNDWRPSLGWLFLVGGYIGLLAGVTILAEAMKSRIRTSSVELTDGPGTWYCAIQDGNIDKDGTVGHVLVPLQQGTVEVAKVCCLHESTLANEIAGTGAAIILLVSFALHYLGLRSVQWWVSISELTICLGMVCIRTVASRTPRPFTSSEYVFDTELRSVGVIRPTQRQRPALLDVALRPREVNFVRAHFGVRNMGPLTEGDMAAFLLADRLKSWTQEKLDTLFNRLGPIQGQISRSYVLSSYVVVHVGGTGLLSKEGYIRPAEDQVWAQEIMLEQIGYESLIGCCANGLMRNEKLELMRDFAGLVKQQVHIPAADSVADWWLRSESTNNWQSTCSNLQWACVLPLALLLVSLSRTEDIEVRRVLSAAGESARISAGQVAMTVAEELNSGLAAVVEV